MIPEPRFHLSRHAGAKLAWLASLGLWMALCYFPAQIWNPQPPSLVPPLPFEPSFVYHPAWVLVYQSVWLAHTAAILAPACLSAVRRYARDIMVTYGLAAPFFWTVPTTVNRPEDGDALYRMLILAVDGESNALPSLHAVMASLVVLHFAPSVPRWGRILLVLWWGILLCSTLATGQHRLLDILAGTLLAIAVSIALGRSNPPNFPRSP